MSIRETLGTVVVVGLGGATIATGQSPEPPDRRTAWIPARPDYRWSFPRDHWSHPGYKTEWWYFTGLLRAVDDSSRQFGYQFTLFRVGVLPGRPDLASDWAASDMVMGHAALTDLSTGRHHFSEVLNRAMPVLGGFGTPPDSLLAWTRAPGGTADRWTLRWSGRGFHFTARDDWQRIGLDLVTRPRKPVALQGPNGFSRKGRDPAAASLYYSLTRLATTGTVIIDGTPVAVIGESWMDKEFGSNQLGADQTGWDWFSLRLDDGRDLMLYILRGTADARYASGSVVARDGTVRTLAPEQFSIRVTATWVSPATDARYPSRWMIAVPDEQLAVEVVPDLAAQENRSQLVERLYYWEGRVGVYAGGRRIGGGYVELTGYGDSVRPAI